MKSSVHCFELEIFGDDQCLDQQVRVHPRYRNGPYTLCRRNYKSRIMKLTSDYDVASLGSTSALYGPSGHRCWILEAESRALIRLSIYGVYPYYLFIQSQILYHQIWRPSEAGAWCSGLKFSYVSRRKHTVRNWICIHLVAAEHTHIRTWMILSLQQNSYRCTVAGGCRQLFSLSVADC